MEFDIFVQLMCDLWEGMGRAQSPGKMLLRMWYITLRSMAPEDLARAILVYLEHHADKYITAKLLLELSGIRQTEDLAAITGWNEVVSEINRVGAYQSPVFGDPRTSATVKHLGGWVMICDTKPDELHKWTRQNFLKTFAAIKTRVHEPLKNLIDSANAQTGHVAAAESVRLRIAADQVKRIQ